MNEKITLNEKQESAIELILQGLNDGEIAERVGVSRQSVNTWRNHDESFMEALQVRRGILQEVHMNQLEQLVTESIEVLREALGEQDQKTRLKTAMYVLKFSGLQGYAKGTLGQKKEESSEDLLHQALQELAEETGFRDKYGFSLGHPARAQRPKDL